MTATVCPCCGQSVRAANLAVLALACGLNERETRILRKIWHGHGKPVQSGELVRVMYEDDPDGGPTMPYIQLRKSIHHIRRKLAGSGVTIENKGRNCGYSLRLEGIEQDGWQSQPRVADRYARA